MFACSVFSYNGESCNWHLLIQWSYSLLVFRCYSKTFVIGTLEIGTLEVVYYVYFQEFMCTMECY